MAPTDPRYIVITSAGGVATLGRHGEPDADHLAIVTNALIAGNETGWLAIASSTFNTRTKPVITMVRVLVEPTAAFADAVKLAGGKA